jgi:hypothetical protein
MSNCTNDRFQVQPQVLEEKQSGTSQSGPAEVPSSVSSVLEESVQQFRLVFDNASSARTALIGLQRQTAVRLAPHAPPQTRKRDHRQVPTKIQGKTSPKRKWKFLNLLQHQKGLKSEKWPTFPEFVFYLLDCVKQGQPLDMHWTPITDFCTPCMFDFDIIAHTETLQEDQQYIIKKAHLEGLVEPQWRNAGHGATARQIRKYYSQLSRSQILQLYHIYRYVLFRLG